MSLNGVNGVSVKIETITPQRAKELLKTNVSNRKLDKQSVKNLVTAIKDGRFLITNSGIGIDKNGLLVDGQHRLTAIVDADIPCDLAVFSGLEPKTKILIDTGKVRTLSNQLQICELAKYESNGKDIDLSTIISPFATYVFLYTKGYKNIIRPKGLGITTDVITNFVEENNDELVKTAVYIKEKIKNAKYLNAPILSFIYQINKFIDKDKIESFISILVGDETPENKDICPAFKLRYSLIDNHSKKRGRLNTDDLIALYSDGCNKFMEGIVLGSGSKTLRYRERKDGRVKLKVDFNKMSEDGKKFFETIKRHDILTIDSEQ